MGRTTGSQTKNGRATSKRTIGFTALLSTAAATLVLAAPPAAQAIPVPGVQARAIISPSFSCAIPGCAPVDNIVQASTGPVHADGFAIGGFGGVGSATSDVTFGAMHLYGHFANQGNAGGTGQIRDLLTFGGVAPGTLVDVTFGLLVEGGIDGVGGSEGRWQLQADLGGGAYDINAFARNSDLGGYHGSPFGLYEATVTLQAGFAAPLDIELGASAVSISGGEAVADLVDSLYWTGISSVKVNGVALDSFTVTSASGTDWSQSFVPPPTGIPEPATWAMMLLGFGGLGAAMRAHRRTGRSLV
ncbi:MAG: motif putative anchor domain protein [Phenylobacterium sp.]|nr:motif putative anchor domain protein [Phenylobacterium sp.]